MSGERIHRDMQWSAEDRARHKAIREQFQRERPTLTQLVASGEYTAPMPHGIYLELRAAMRELVAAREAAGLRQSDVAERSGIPEAVVGDLERGVFDGPAVEALMRYAAAVGKKIALTVADADPRPAAGS